MQELKSLWRKLEKSTIYFILFVFFALQLISLFVPSIATSMDARGSLMFIAAVLLIIFRFLDERLGGKDQEVIKVTNGFVQGVINLLKQNKEYKSVDILAQNGFLYFTALKESGVKIRNVRLLFRSAEDFTSMQFPSDDKSKAEFKQQLSQMVLSFQQLQKGGKISKLSIAYYAFDPTTHFMLIDGRYLHFGLFQLQIKYPGTEVSHTYIVKIDDKLGETLINDFKAQFEAIWAKYYQPSLNEKASGA